MSSKEVKTSRRVIGELVDLFDLKKVTKGTPIIEPLVPGIHRIEKGGLRTEYNVNPNGFVVGANQRQERIILDSKIESIQIYGNPPGKVHSQLIIQPENTKSITSYHISEEFSKKGRKTTLTINLKEISKEGKSNQSLVYFLQSKGEEIGSNPRELLLKFDNESGTYQLEGLSGKDEQFSTKTRLTVKDLILLGLEGIPTVSNINSKGYEIVLPCGNKILTISSLGNAFDNSVNNLILGLPMNQIDITEDDNSHEGINDKSITRELMRITQIPESGFRLYPISNIIHGVEKLITANENPTEMKDFAYIDSNGVVYLWDSGEELREPSWIRASEEHIKNWGRASISRSKYNSDVISEQSALEILGEEEFNFGRKLISELEKKILEQTGSQVYFTSGNQKLPEIIDMIIAKTDGAKLMFVPDIMIITSLRGEKLTEPQIVPITIGGLVELFADPSEVKKSFANAKITKTKESDKSRSEDHLIEAIDNEAEDQDAGNNIQEIIDKFTGGIIDLGGVLDVLGKDQFNTPIQGGWHFFEIHKNYDLNKPEMFADEFKGRIPSLMELFVIGIILSMDKNSDNGWIWYPTNLMTKVPVVEPIVEPNTDPKRTVINQTITSLTEARQFVSFSKERGVGVGVLRDIPQYWLNVLTIR